MSKKYFYSGKKMSNAERDDGDSNRIIVGNSDNGGAANANWNSPENSNDNLGFRLAVVLSLQMKAGSLNPTSKHSSYFNYLGFENKIFFIVNDF